MATRERDVATGVYTNKYQHTDALGSPIAVTDASRTVILTNEFEPYGKVVNHAEVDGPLYTGHVQDASSALSYMQQRYYDPMIGRFLSTDPVTANSATGANFNRYWYANNNPYKFTDPDGRAPCRNDNPNCNRDGDPASRERQRKCAMTCLGESGRATRPYDGKLKKVQEKHPKVTTDMADMAFDRFAIDNPRSSMTKGKEWGWEMESGANGELTITPSKEGAAGKVGWSVARGTTLALGHTHGRGGDWYLRYFSPDDVAAGNYADTPVFIGNSYGDFRVYVPGMRLNGEVPEGLLRGGAAEGVLLCQECVPVGE